MIGNPLGGIGEITGVNSNPLQFSPTKKNPLLSSPTQAKVQASVPQMSSVLNMTPVPQSSQPIVPMSVMPSLTNNMSMFEKPLPEIPPVTLPNQIQTKIPGINAPSVGSQFYTPQGAEKTQISNFSPEMKLDIKNQVMPDTTVNPSTRYFETVDENKYNTLSPAGQTFVGLNEKRTYIADQIRASDPTIPADITDDQLVDDFTAQNGNDFFQGDIDKMSATRLTDRDKRTIAQGNLDAIKQIQTQYDSLTNYLVTPKGKTSALQDFLGTNLTWEGWKKAMADEVKAIPGGIRDAIAGIGKGARSMPESTLASIVNATTEPYANILATDEVIFKKTGEHKLTEEQRTHIQSYIDKMNGSLRDIFNEANAGVNANTESKAYKLGEVVSIAGQTAPLVVDIGAPIISRIKEIQAVKSALPSTVNIESTVAGTKIAKPTYADKLIEKQLKFTPSEIRKYKSEYKETPGQTLNNEGLIASGEETLDTKLADMKRYQTEKKNGLSNIAATVTENKNVTQMATEVAAHELKVATPEEIANGLQQQKYEGYVEKAKSGKLTQPELEEIANGGQRQKYEWYVEKAKSGKLTHPELEEIKSNYERNKSLKYDLAKPADEAQRQIRLDTAVREFQQSEAEKAGFTNIKEINQQISKSKALADLLSKDVERFDGLSFPDYILLSESVINPKALSIFVGKKIAQTGRFNRGMIKILNRINGKQTMVEKIADLAKIRKISSETEFNNFLKEGELKNPALPAGTVAPIAEGGVPQLGGKPITPVAPVKPGIIELPNKS